MIWETSTGKSAQQGCYVTDTAGDLFHRSIDGHQRRIGSLEGHYDWGGQRFLFDWDNRLVFCGSFQNGTVSCLDGESLEVKWKWTCPTPQSMALSPDGNSLWVISEERTLWRVGASESCLMKMPHEYQSIYPGKIQKVAVLDCVDWLETILIGTDRSWKVHKRSFAVTDVSCAAGLVGICETKQAGLMVFSTESGKERFSLPAGHNSQLQRCQIVPVEGGIHVAVERDVFDCHRELEYFLLQDDGASQLSLVKLDWSGGGGAFSEDGTFFRINGEVVFPPWAIQQGS